MYHSWTYEEWLIAFPKVPPTPEAGRMACNAAGHAAEGGLLPSWAVMMDYYNYLLYGRPALTQQQLAACVATALSRNMRFSFILDHALSYL